MKKISTLLGSVLVAFLTTGLQAYAADPTFTDSFTVGTGSTTGGAYLPNGYSGSISDSVLLAPGNIPFSDSGYTITSGTMALDIYDGTGSAITLKLDNNTINVGTQTPTGAANTYDILTYTLNSAELAYINGNNPIKFEVSGDCYLDSGTLTVNANQSQSGVAPDGGSTVMLLGGVLSALALMRRKMA